MRPEVPFLLFSLLFFSFPSSPVLSTGGKLFAMEGSSTPLADYFWIAGVEAISYTDAPQPSPQLDDTINEDGEPDSADNIVPAATRATARHSRQSSLNRLSKISSEARNSVGTLDELDGNTRSNRSSATIRPAAPLPQGGHIFNGIPHDPSMGDFDFDKALLKFAVERENFLDDLSFSAGAKLQARPPMVNPRTERIKAEDGDLSGRKSPLRSIRGSIRRKMSFRDMNSMRKQPAAPKAGESTYPFYDKAMQRSIMY